MPCWCLNSSIKTSQYAVMCTMWDLIRQNKRQGHCIIPKQSGPTGGHRSKWTLLTLLCYRDLGEWKTVMSQHWQRHQLQKRHTMLGRQWSRAEVLLDGCSPRHSIGPPVSLWIYFNSGKHFFLYVSDLLRFLEDAFLPRLLGFLESGHCLFSSSGTGRAPSLAAVVLSWYFCPLSRQLGCLLVVVPCTASFQDSLMMLYLKSSSRLVVFIFKHTSTVLASCCSHSQHKVRWYVFGEMTVCSICHFAFSFRHLSSMCF